MVKTGDVDPRVERAAKNEALFREVNERAREIVEGFEHDVLRAVCECSLADCTETIEISLKEYEAVRRYGERFALVAGHDDPAIEHVVERTDRYIVIEKMGDGAELARELDPRSGNAG